MARQPHPDEARAEAAAEAPALVMTPEWQTIVAEAGEQMEGLAALCSRLAMRVQCLEHEVRAIHARLAECRTWAPSAEPEPEATHGRQLCPCGCWIDAGARRHCVIAGCPAK